MKILLVHGDKFPWASTWRAEALKKQWLDDEVDIVDRWHLPDGDGYDVIHILHSGGMSNIGDYLLKYRSKVFTTLASQRTLDGNYDKMEDLLKIYKQTVCCVCKSPELASILKSLIKQENAVYIPNGVDEKLFNREFVVGYVGAKDSAAHKGLDLVERACHDLGLKLKIVFENQIPHYVMPYFYEGIDCLVIPSLSEGCNNPMLEALAMNKPVISTKTGIAEELKGVILVDRSVESITKVLRRLSGRIQILEKYTWKNVARQYHTLYETFGNHS